MHLRRPVAAVMTALALFGGTATLAACGDPAGSEVERRDGTTDDEVNEGDSEEEGPNYTDPERDSDDDEDTQDPD
ncbi:hypothetical protein [Blastococcus sp. SYSU D00820]